MTKAKRIQAIKSILCIFWRTDTIIDGSINQLATAIEKAIVIDKKELSNQFKKVKDEEWLTTHILAKAISTKQVIKIKELS